MPLLFASLATLVQEKRAEVGFLLLLSIFAFGNA
jgi:hypothetical protein